MSTKNLERLRSKIAALTTERAALIATPPGRDEVRARLRAQLVTLAARGDDHLALQVRRVARRDMDPGALLTAPVVNGGRAEPSTALLGPMLAAVLGVEGLMGAFEQYVSALPDGITEADRRDRLAAIDADLWALEVEEELIITMAEDRGEFIARRGNAMAAAVLWLPDIVGTV